MKKSTRFHALRAYVATCVATAERHTRAALLALAFARGVPYRVLEPVTREAKEYASAVPAKQARAHARWRAQMAREVAQALAGRHAALYTAEQIAAWLAEPEPPARRAAREKARDAWLAKGRAMREAAAAKRAALYAELSRGVA